MDDTTQVNIPLLRKAVEWAEAEAAKPFALREWYQAHFRLDPTEPLDRGLRARIGKAPECGTCYCIAGFIEEQVGNPEGLETSEVAALALGIEGDWLAASDEQRDHLFSASNTIEDVRRIAEEIAGERL